MSTLTRSRRARRARGSAAVELSIMCVVLVPLMMYVSFLQDALLFKLDGQEAVISAPYDFMTQAYDGDQAVNAEDVGRQNRRTHCDHSSAYNTYSDANYDCGTEASRIHHFGEWSVHQCWIVKDAQQVRCKIDDTYGTALIPNPSPPVLAWAARWNKGGIAKCNARIGIMNYYLPNKFFEFWSKQSVNGGDLDGTGRLEKFTGDAHADAPKGSSKNALVLPRDTFAMMADPWALNHIDDIDPMAGAPQTTALWPGGFTQYHPLLDRSGHYYVWPQNLSKLNSARSFRSSASDFLTLSAEIDGLGDSPFSMPIRYSAANTRPDDDGNYASGWADDRQSSMEGNRGDFYFGLQDDNSDGT